MDLATHSNLATLVQRFATWVRSLSGFAAVGVTLFAGLASALAFAPIFAWPVLFFTLPVLIWRLDASATTRGAFVTGWWFGFGFFFAGLFWIGEAFLVEAELFAWLLPFAVTLLPTALACFWAAASMIARRLYWQGNARVLMLAITLSVAEYARGHLFTGLPWNLMGYALTSGDAMMQIASMIGVYGLTVLAFVVFPLPLIAAAAQPLDARKALAVLLMAAVPPLTLLAFGTWRLSTLPQSDNVDGVHLRIVQPSVLQREKWMAAHQRRIFEDHLNLSRTTPDGQVDDLSTTTHVIWPEAAMPFLPLEHPEAIAAIANLLPARTTLITGALRRDIASQPAGDGVLPEARLYNSILVFNDAGDVATRYDKLHLVPWGEYLPLESLLTSLGLKKLTHGRGAFSAGAAPRPLLAVPGLPPAIGLVCYEALFPAVVVQGSKRPAVILNVTNDGWFGQTSGPHQHFHQTRIRAVEEGLPIVRAANNGISAIIDAAGRVKDKLGLDVKGVIDGPLPVAIPATVYARVGDAGFLALLIFLAAIVMWSACRTKGILKHQ